MKRLSNLRRRNELRGKYQRVKRSWKEELLRNAITFVAILLVFWYPVLQFQSTIVPVPPLLACGLVVGLIAAAIALKRQPFFFWFKAVPVFIASGFIFCSLLLMINRIFADNNVTTLKAPITERYLLKRNTKKVFFEFDGIRKSINATGTDNDLFNKARYVLLKAQKGALGYYVIKDKKLSY